MMQTLTGPFEREQEIRKSRFLARAAPVKTSDDAENFIRTIAQSAPEATHHGWAWQVGPRCRCHDDGEPSGTAGRPILQVITAQQLDFVAVVVTRWFGGIKLGAGGLIRAYSGAAAECLREAPKEPIIERVTLTFHTPFSLLSLVQARLQSFTEDAPETSFDAQGAQMTLTLPEAQREALSDHLADLSSGQISVRLLTDDLEHQTNSV